MKDSTFGGLIVLCILAIAIFLGVLVNNGTIQSKSGRTYTKMLRDDYELISDVAWMRIDSLARVARQDTAKWDAFLECSKDEGDAGCDSCFTAIYGYSLEER